MTSATADEFERHRPRLFGLAYRMLASAHEAEDTVQDAYLRFSGADRTEIAHPAAWLATTVTRLCLNRLSSARARREEYVGVWLPEPVLTSDGTLGPPPPPEERGSGPAESAERRDAVSFAVLVLLERLTPTERAVYVLREAFAYGHREIAGTLGLSEANCRQLYRRAEQRLAAPEGRFEATPARREELVDSFLSAARDGDLAGLERLLSAEVTWWSDGGGRVRSALRPIEGRTKVLRFLAGAFTTFAAGMTFTAAEINGGPGLLVRDGDALAGTVSFECHADGIAGVRVVLNPDKLEFVRRQLGPA